MAYISYDASVKMKKGDIKGYGNHVERKGKNVNHSNEDIRKNDTEKNIEFIISGDNRKFEEKVNDRLNDYKGVRKMRSDAVLVRGLVFQPSSDEFEGLSDQEKSDKITKFTKDLVPWLVKEFGEKNLMNLTAHLDESNPHLHVGVMPMTEDGRLSQKDFFKGPQSLASKHRTLREHMNSKGWNFNLENRYEDSKHYNDSEFKRNAQSIEKAREEYTAKKRILSSDDKIKSEIKSDIYTEVIGDIKDDVMRENNAVISAAVEKRIAEERKELEREKVAFDKEKEKFEKFKENIRTAAKRLFRVIRGSSLVPQEQDKLVRFIKTGEAVTGEPRVTSNGNLVENTVEGLSKQLRVVPHEKVLRSSGTQESDEIEL